MTTGPSATLPAAPPTGTTSGTGLCCACPADDTILTNGEGNYFTISWATYGGLFNGCHVGITRTETGGRVTITKKVKFEYTNAADPDLALGMNIFSAAEMKLNEFAGLYGVEISQPGCAV